MDIFISLFYLLFSICIVYPPIEVVSAGFTIPQLFDSYLGSENINFIGYHMKRITITVLIQSALPLGYVFCLWLGGERGEFMLMAATGTALFPLLMLYRVVCWFENEARHPAVKPLVPYAMEGTDWRVVAAFLNTEFKNVDKVSVSLGSMSKFVATETWLIKVSQYKLDVIKQRDCNLIATGIDNHTISPSGEEEMQFINIAAVPTRPDVLKFSIRITTTLLRDLQPRLRQAVQLPEHINLMPTLIERFIKVFKNHIRQNPLYEYDQEPESCIGCMQAQADVKLNRNCMAPPPQFRGGPPQCQQCNCRVLWCASCMARWWAARATGPPSTWLASRCTCPVCRSVFCLLDVCPAVSTYN